MRQKEYNKSQKGDLSNKIMETHFPHNGYAPLQRELSLDNIQIQEELAFPEEDQEAQETVWDKTTQQILTDPTQWG